MGLQSWVYLLLAEESGERQCLITCSVKTLRTQDELLWMTPALAKHPALQQYTCRSPQSKTGSLHPLLPSFNYRLHQGLCDISAFQMESPLHLRGRGGLKGGGGDKNDLSCFSWIQNFTISESGFYTHTHIQRKGRRGWNEEESRVSSWHIEWRQYVVKVLK